MFEYINDVPRIVLCIQRCTTMSFFFDDSAVSPLLLSLFAAVHVPLKVACLFTLVGLYLPYFLVFLFCLALRIPYQTNYRKNMCY